MSMGLCGSPSIRQRTLYDKIFEIKRLEKEHFYIFNNVLDSKNLLKHFVAGLPRARSARGTEPHTHGIWSTSFRLVVTWLTERTNVRTYASTDCTGRVGETIKRKGGVSQACLGKSSSLTLTIWSIDSCQNRITTDQYPMTISLAHVSTHRGDVIYLEAVRWPVNRFTRSRTMFNHTF